MTAAFFIVLIVAWVFFSAWRFYKNVNWDEPPGYTPDLAEIRKKEAQLDHIQQVLDEAHEAGKLSAGAADEFRRYREAEIRALRAPTEPEKKVIQ